jgi:hypothetical protein
MITDDHVQYVRLMTFINHQVLNDDDMKYALEYELKYSSHTPSSITNNQVVELAQTIIKRLSEIPDFYSKIKESLEYWQDKEKPEITREKEFYYDPGLYTMFIKSLPLYSLEKITTNMDNQDIVEKVYNERINKLKQTLDREKPFTIEFERIKDIKIYVDNDSIKIIYLNTNDLFDSAIHSRLLNYNYEKYNWIYNENPEITLTDVELISLCKDDKVIIS